MELVENLDGWWHAYFDTATAWQQELADPHISTPAAPSVGWDNLDDHKESVRVPGNWRKTLHGFKGVAWYWRPFVVPADWHEGTVMLHLGAVCGQVSVFLDRVLLKTNRATDSLLIFDLSGQLEPEVLYTLYIRVVHGDDTGGIIGSVSLEYSSLETD
jgi:hypothetical protein